MLKTGFSVLLLALSISAIGLALLLRKDGAPAAALAIVGCAFLALAVAGRFIDSAWFTWVLGAAAVFGLAAVAFQILGSIAIVNGMNAQARLAAEEKTMLTTASFRRIEEFILTHGDREAYGNRYNDNPHFALSGFDVFLDPGFPRAVNSPLRPDEYDELLVRDWNTKEIYFSARVSQDRRLLEFDPSQKEQLEQYVERMLAVIQKRRL